MASDQAWVQNFRGRCEFVGWTVQLTKSNHYKVHDRAGRLLFTYSGTPGDRRAMQNALSQAKRAGLEQLETGLKLVKERDRLERIERDRELNGHREFSMTATTATVTPSRADVTYTSEEMKLTLRDIEPTTDAQVSELGQVNGIAVVMRSRAMLPTPPNGTLTAHENIEEVLLADDTTIFVCCENGCDYTADNGISVRAHRKAHGPAAQAKRLAREKAELEAQLAERHRRQVEGGKKAAETRKARAAETANVNANVTASGEAPTQASSRSVTSAEIQRRVNQLAFDTQLIATDLSVIVDVLEQLKRDVASLPDLDPEVVEKAARFDAMKNIFS